MKKIISFWIVGLLAVSALHAAEPSKAGKKQSAKEAKAAQEAMMAQMVKMGTPGENHKALEPLVGNWNHMVRYWMDPNAKPEESKGTSTNRWILGGRFLQAEAKGNMNGQPFEGMGITGYDNLKGEYQSMWIDNMVTGFMLATAQYDATLKTFNETGSFSCPMTNEKARPFRAKWKIMDNNNYTYEMYQAGPDGKEFKAMEITYVRADAMPSVPEQKK